MKYKELRLELAWHLAEMSRVLKTFQDAPIPLNVDLDAARYIAKATADEELKQRLGQLIPELEQEIQDFLDVSSAEPHLKIVED